MQPSASNHENLPYTTICCIGSLNEFLLKMEPVFKKGLESATSDDLKAVIAAQTKVLTKKQMCIGNVLLFNLFKNFDSKKYIFHDSIKEKKQIRFRMS